MKVELFPFQNIAVETLRDKADQAIIQYRSTRTPQVVSLQAPTGSGKTVMMTAFIENVLFGDARHDEQPNAVFVWLSDSPALNLQSKEKIDSQSDRMRFGQTVIVEDASFDRETFEDGHVYFINTQKLSRAGNLGQKSDARQWTIWQTIQNTVERKCDRLFFIIDEAHRGMQGNEGGRQTAIMQRFLRGWTAVGLSPMPVVIGMSATPDRFNTLVEELPSTIQRVIVPTDEVRASGLLKDRIVITYPEDAAKQDPMGVLAAATCEWLDKCRRWQYYSVTQHARMVNPVFVIQVKAGSETHPVSETDLDAVLKKIEEVAQVPFSEGEVVQTFGSTGELTVNGLKVPHVDPSAIAADRAIKVVLFKENLSTGWDCPRAETMMSFRRAEDYTYIAQLLGRMIRTPLQCHVMVDDSLNDVKLYLPYFDAETVDRVIGELRSSECGDIPAWVGGDVLGSGNQVPWGTARRIRRVLDDPNQMDLFANLQPVEEQKTETQRAAEDDEAADGEDEASPRPAEQTPPIAITQIPQGRPPTGVPGPVFEASETQPAANAPKPIIEQPKLQLEIDRKDVIRRINAMGIVRYEVRTHAQKIHDYLLALLRLSSLLTRTQINPRASRDVFGAITDIMHDAIAEIRRQGQYAALEKKIREMMLEAKTYDAFGETVGRGVQMEMAFITESDIDRQYREADLKLGRAGLPNEYARRFAEDDEVFKIDCIIFVRDEVCMARVYDYAKAKFHELDDNFRRYVASSPEDVRAEYDEIVASSDVVSKHNFILPETIAPFAASGGDLYANHLYADDQGYARIALGSPWEKDLIAEEEQRNDFVCWLRNRENERWSLCLPRRSGTEVMRFFPDVLVVRRDYNPNNPYGYIVDVLEPHSPSFSDNLSKAKSLAHYANEARQLGRIQLIREEKRLGGGKCLRRLDFSRGAVREAVSKAQNDEELNHIFETMGFVEG